jgi:hypothetical protein
MNKKTDKLLEEFPDQVREAQQRHRMQQPAEIEQRPGP